MDGRTSGAVGRAGGADRARWAVGRGQGLLVEEPAPVDDGQPGEMVFIPDESSA